MEVWECKQVVELYELQPWQKKEETHHWMNKLSILRSISVTLPAVNIHFAILSLRDQRELTSCVDVHKSAFTQAHDRFQVKVLTTLPMTT